MIIVWFRNDLRISDNPALFEAAKQGDVLPVYILDDENAGEHTIGAASRVWLHHSLAALNKSLGGKLNLFKGDAKKQLKQLIEDHKASGLYWNRSYEPWSISRDKDIKESLGTHTEVKTFNGSLLWEPWTIMTQNDTPYKVFTPYYKKGCLKADPPRTPCKKPDSLNLISYDNSLEPKSLELLPDIAWNKPMEEHWDMSEEGAHEALSTFLDEGLKGYKEGRNFPTKPHVSRLSPYLHFGQISPHQVWYAAQMKGEAEGWDTDTAHFLSEMGWREFSNYLLYHFPELPRKNFNDKFDAFPWQEEQEKLQAWQRGQTGIPIVDAGMRELWQTGYIHNRVRMIVGSFLVKNLLLHWHEGEAWFWDCLFDADLANNSASWQWIAGSGADAAPYFRIFNPVTQSERFDPEGQYIKQYIPELAELEPPYLFAPWQAPTTALQSASIELGSTYPKPIIDLKASRERAMEAYQTMKQKLED